MIDGCQCEQAGECPVLGRSMTPRQHAICRGTAAGLSAEEMDYYRHRWRLLAPGTPPEGFADALTLEEHAELVELTGDPQLAGNRLARFIGLFGLPPCGGCSSRQAWLNRLHNYLRDVADTLTAMRPPFVRTRDLVDDTYRLAAKLPSRVAGVVGISRSGILPANLLAQHLHLPMWVLRQDTNNQQAAEHDWGAGDVVACGNGWRLHDRAAEPGPIVVVDDTQMTGRSVRRARPIAEAWAAQQRRELLWAVVYQNPDIAPADKADFHARLLQRPHFLEWNLFNSTHLPRTAMDFDGILCRDCLPGEDDDGPRYLEFLKRAEPLYFVRKQAIPLIVTACLEKYRTQRLAWLTRHGIRCHKLVMGPWRTLDERRGQVARWKARHFAESGLSWFVESCPQQAREIAELTGKPVICPATGKVY